MKKFVWFVLVALILSLPLSCSDGTGPASDGMTSFLLTDAPFPYELFSRVDVFVVSVSTSISPDTSGPDAGYIQVAAPNKRFNLLDLQGGNTADMGAFELAADSYLGLRLVIDTDASSMTLRDGTVLTNRSDPGVDWQGTGEKTLNALIESPIVVPGEGATIVVDFDVGRSFLPGGDTLGGGEGSYLFLPFIRAVNSAATGSIRGTITDLSGAAVVDASVTIFLGDPAMPENTWSTLATGRSDAAGGYFIAYLTPRTYIVRANAPTASGLQGGTVTDVVVTAGEDTEGIDLSLAAAN
jgi:hypothetical protein